MVETKGKHDQVHIGTIVQVGADVAADRCAASGQRQDAASWPAAGSSSERRRRRLLTSPPKRPRRSPRTCERSWPRWRRSKRRLRPREDPKETASIYAKRTDLLEQLVERSKDDAERLQWLRQLADSTSMAVQCGAYPDGLKHLAGDARSREKEARKRGNDQLSRVSAPDGRIRAWPANAGSRLREDSGHLDGQSEKIHRGARQVGRHARRDASACERPRSFRAAKKTPRSWYGRIGEDFPKSPVAKKAAGAKARLGARGKPHAASRADARRQNARYFRARRPHACWSTIGQAGASLAKPTWRSSRPFRPNTPGKASRSSA